MSTRLSSIHEDYRLQRVHGRWSAAAECPTEVRFRGHGRHVGGKEGRHRRHGRLQVWGEVTVWCVSLIRSAATERTDGDRRERAANA